MHNSLCSGFTMLAACVGLAMASAGQAAQAAAAVPAALRPLRYEVEGTDIVCRNGPLRFNRPLYGGNSGFRIDAGDRPEYVLYLPGRGGNLRLGLRVGSGSAAVYRWCVDLAEITARYRAGSLVHELRDPLLGSSVLTLTALPMDKGEGLVVKVERSQGGPPLSLLWAYGGVTGERGRRDGDLGGEKEPPERFFEFRAEYARLNRIELKPAGFQLTSKPGILTGSCSPDTQLAVADGTHWADPARLFSSTGSVTESPVVVGQVSLAPGQSTCLALARVPAGRPAGDPAPDLAALFRQAEAHRRDLAEQLLIETPDPYINAATAALNVAADAVWDEKSSTFMHGAVAWRIPLLGWRAVYAGDVLGSPARTRRHLDSFIGHQLQTAIPGRLPPADPEYNLSRSLVALKSNGYIPNLREPNFYDMNLVAVDAFFRHLLWTGDLAYARRLWPAIKRHLAWEKRLFRRGFGQDPLPLYEAYACIWASDELIYNGGGATHSSAYNFWHNTMAARLATALGEDPSPYAEEAALIRRGMHRELWLPDKGWFGEFKDLLGAQTVHPNFGVWTFYHSVDSDTLTSRQAWEMSRFVDTQIPRMVLAGPGVPAGTYTLSTTSWMPYIWSTNNVAVAESAHTALAYWQAGRTEQAFPLLKGALLDSMFLGQCPGNVGMTTALDAFSAERYRDFSDTVGITARALVEGLFGIQPDLLAGELRLCPGFPEAWKHASVRHPALGFAFSREDGRDSYRVEARFSSPVLVRLQIVARAERVAQVRVNGTPATWTRLPDRVGRPRIEVLIPAGSSSCAQVEVLWEGRPPVGLQVPAVCSVGSPLRLQTGPARATAVHDPQGILGNPRLGAGVVEAQLQGTLGHRTAFVRLEQGDLAWWEPLACELREPLELVPLLEQDGGGLRFRIRNNTASKLDVNARVTVGGVSLSLAARAEPFAVSEPLVFPGAGLVPGSHRVRVDLGSGCLLAGTVVNWFLPPPSTAHWEPVNLTAYFNDSIMRIFKNRYLSPRSPYCSLSIPAQGIGGWCLYKTTAEIDDAGLRSAARRGRGLVGNLLGIPLETPGEPTAKNILFTSLWDNHPRESVVQLQGRASRVALLMAGTTNPMQSRLDNGEVLVSYADGTQERLPLHNPTNWWPIEQDYYIDQGAFARPEPVPPRLNLRTGELRVLRPADLTQRDALINGGAATLLDLPLDPTKELRSLTVRTLANEVVIGLMALSLERPAGTVPPAP